MNIEDIKALVKDVLHGVDARAEWLRKLHEDEGNTTRYYHFLYALACRMKPRGVVETGTRWGFSAAQMAAASFHSTIVTIEIDTLYLPRLERTPDLKRFPNVVWLRSDSRKAKEEVLNHVSEVDILYLDSAHEYSVVAEEYRLYAPMVRPGGVIAVDDIHFNEGLERFWKELPEPKVELGQLHTVRNGYNGTREVGFGVLVKPEVRHVG